MELIMSAVDGKLRKSCLSPRVALSENGPELSQVVLGLWRLSSWNMSVAERIRYLYDALELGITTIDQADIYGDYLGESLLGEAFQAEPGLASRFEIVGKCGIQFPSAQRPAHRSHIYNTSRSHIIHSVERSLSDMRIEALDVLLIHRPDPLMKVDEVAEAFLHLQSSGKVKHFGVSNFSVTQWELLNSRFPLVTNQVECSVLQMGALTDGSFDVCQRWRVKPMIWSALARGLIFTGNSEQALHVRQTLEKFAQAHGVSPTVIALAWLFALPAEPLVLTGSSRRQVLEETVQATQCHLDRDQWFELWRASQGRDIP